MDGTNKVERLIEPVLAGLGYELVRVQMNRTSQATLQIMAERADRRGMRVEDCVRISREVTTVLETQDPIGGDYEVEVSSPGIDRPLVKLADYERYAGHEVRLEVDPPIAGQKRFHGNIGAVDGDAVALDTEEGAVTLPFTAIRKAKLVLTDRLIAAVQIEAKEAAAHENASAPMHL